ncbi:MAG: hypothetical protein Q4D58_11090 [Synergistaceae bacterium]|nr:hypothetical protein [Synergistaceae bacterium]
MLFRIATGFFTWDVYKWALVFLTAALIVGLMVSLAAHLRGGRLLPLRRREEYEESRPFPLERLAAAFIDNCVSPWRDIAAGGLLGIAALTALFAVAVFTG